MLGTWRPEYGQASIQNLPIEDLTQYYEIGNPLHTAHQDTVNRMIAVGNRLGHAIHMNQIQYRDLLERYQHRLMEDHRDIIDWRLDTFPNGIRNLMVP